MNTCISVKENLTNKSICEKEKLVLSQVQKLPYCPIAIKSGDGALLYDYDDNKYIDFSMFLA